jgi:hypothetical protein
MEEAFRCSCTTAPALGAGIGSTYVATQAAIRDSAMQAFSAEIKRNDAGGTTA